METTILHLMKRALLFLGIMTWANLAKGQEIMTDFWHKNGNFYSDIRMVETTDKCMITGCCMLPEYGWGSTPIGIMFYKFSSDGIVKDSLLIYDNIIGSLPLLFERNPKKTDHFVYAYFMPTDNTLFFRMRTIDMYLNLINDTILEIDHSTELFFNYSYDLFVDPNGDIIASYSIKDDPNETFMTYFLRIGFDGTLKCRTEVPQIRYFDLLQRTIHSGMFNESPVQYCYWGSNHDLNNGDNPPIRLYVLDSLFNVVEEIRFYRYHECWYYHGLNCQFVPIDDQNYLHVNRYWENDSNYYSIEWILLEKRNRQHNRQAIALVGESALPPEAIRAIAIDGNTIYLSYMSVCSGNNHLVLLRLDGDLNIQWERHFLSQDTFHYGTCMKVLDDGSIAVASYTPNISPNSISVVIIKDNYDDLEELGIHVRPYAYYPNPARDQLHMEFSPDVQPAQVELYDLQGRLVRTQNKAFRNIDMSQLPAGTYTMRVIMEDGMVYSDKVVKE